MPTPSFGAALTDETVDLTEAGVTLVGDSYIVPGFGAHMDGVGDRVEIAGTNYASTATFSLSMWFTKAECQQNERWEMLYSHTSNETDPTTFFRGGEGDVITSGIMMAIGCAQQRRCLSLPCHCISLPCTVFHRLR